MLPIVFVLHAFAAGAMDRDTALVLTSRAEVAYAAGDHRAALALYDSVATTYVSAALLYNIGNCHFKLNDIPRAILNYERALRLAPGSPDIESNLDLARQQVVDRVDHIGGLALGNFWERLRAGRDVDHWARWSIVLSFLLFGLLSLAALLQRGVRRQVTVAASVITALALASVCALAAHRTNEVRNSGEAIVMQARVEARAEPRQEGRSLFVLHEGTKVTLLSTVNGWQEIRLPSGTVGWLPADALETI
jgi:tetratricopeptide (TPR) repeat protein